MNKYIEIGNRIKELRGALSQLDFAKRLHVPVRTYQRYESGERLPPGPVINALATECNVTTDYILTGDESSLYKALEEKEAELAELKGRVHVLSDQFRGKVEGKGIPLPDDISAFLNVINFYAAKGIDLLDCLKSKFSLPQENTLQTDVQSGINEGEHAPMDPTVAEILCLLRDMQAEDRRVILETIKEKKLLRQLLQERGGSKNTI